MKIPFFRKSERMKRIESNLEEIEYLKNQIVQQTSKKRLSFYDKNVTVRVMDRCREIIEDIKKVEDSGD